MERYHAMGVQSSCSTQWAPGRYAARRSRLFYPRKRVVRVSTAAARLSIAALERTLEAADELTVHTLELFAAVGPFASSAIGSLPSGRLLRPACPRGAPCTRPHFDPCRSFGNAGGSSWTTLPLVGRPASVTGGGVRWLASPASIRIKRLSAAGRGSFGAAVLLR